ncbi:MAG: hypothetical protein LBE50_05560, partial [Gallionellaceae bacterium]|nr:hypothetical protein [Gallionellaceae bacterium]
MRFYQYFLPNRAASVPLSEKIRAGVAAFAGILLLGYALHFLSPPGYPPLVTMVSMSAAAVLLYAVPHSPMAQPWP